jgi:WD40 repeat protein
MGWRLDVVSERLCGTLGHDNIVTSVAVADNTVVIGSEDGIACIWRFDQDQSAV